MTSSGNRSSFIFINRVIGCNLLPPYLVTYLLTYLLTYSEDLFRADSLIDIIAQLTISQSFIIYAFSNTDETTMKEYEAGIKWACPYSTMGVSLGL